MERLPYIILPSVSDAILLLNQHKQSSLKIHVIFLENLVPNLDFWDKIFLLDSRS